MPEDELVKNLNHALIEKTIACIAINFQELSNRDRMDVSCLLGLTKEMCDLLLNHLTVNDADELVVIE